MNLTLRQRQESQILELAAELKLACEGALAALLLEPHVDQQQAIDFLRKVLAKVRDDGGEK